MLVHVFHITVFFLLLVESVRVPESLFIFPLRGTPFPLILLGPTPLPLPSFSLRSWDHNLASTFLYRHTLLSYVNFCVIMKFYRSYFPSSSHNSLLPSVQLCYFYSLNFTQNRHRTKTSQCLPKIVPLLCLSKPKVFCENP